MTTPLAIDRIRHEIVAALAHTIANQRQAGEAATPAAVAQLVMASWGASEAPSVAHAALMTLIQIAEPLCRGAAATEVEWLVKAGELLDVTIDLDTFFDSAGVAIEDKFEGVRKDLMTSAERERSHSAALSAESCLLQAIGHFDEYGNPVRSDAKARHTKLTEIVERHREASPPASEQRFTLGTWTES